MQNGAPLWEDLISKATKLHACLKAAILAVSAYLDAFQKIADAATNARGDNSHELNIYLLSNIIY